MTSLLGKIIELDLWLLDLAARSQTKGFSGISRRNGYVDVFCFLLFFFMNHEGEANRAGDDEEPEWMLEFARKESRRALTEKRQAFEARLAKIRQDEERLKQAQESVHRPRKKQVRIQFSTNWV